MKNILWMPFLLALNGCELLAPRACTSSLMAALSVTLVDATTGGPLVSEDIAVIFSDGAFADTVRFSSDASRPGGPVVLMEDRAGNYRVEANAAGYTRWLLDGVRVLDDGCHVETVHLTAHMQRSN